MSETQVLEPGIVASTEQVSTPVAVQAVPAQKLNAIQLIEQELMGFIKQREQAVANVHAVEGAIQAAQHLLGKLRVEFAKAEAAIKAEAQKLVAEVERVDVNQFIKKEL